MIKTPAKKKKRFGQPQKYSFTNKLINCIPITMKITLSAIKA